MNIDRTAFTKQLSWLNIDIFIRKYLSIMVVGMTYEIVKRFQTWFFDTVFPKCLHAWRPGGELTVRLGKPKFDILRSNRMVPKLCRELPLIKLMMPPKGILMIHSYGEARDHFVHKGISGGPTQLVAINSYGTVLLCGVVKAILNWHRGKIKNPKTSLNKEWSRLLSDVFGFFIDLDASSESPAKRSRIDSAQTNSISINGKEMQMAKL